MYSQQDFPTRDHSGNSEEKYEVLYFKYGAPYRLVVDSLPLALGFAYSGDESGEYSVDRIVGPNGLILEDEELYEAQKEFR